MFTINWKLALIVLVLLPILFVIAVEFRKRILSEYRRVRKMNSKIVGSFNENITGVRVIKALGREKTNLAEFKTITDGMYQSSYRAAWWSALFLPTVQIVSAMAVGATVWYGGFQAQMGSMTIGDIQAFVSYITFMAAGSSTLSEVFHSDAPSASEPSRMVPNIKRLKPTSTHPAARRRSVNSSAVRNFSVELGKY